MAEESSISGRGGGERKIRGKLPLRKKVSPRLTPEELFAKAYELQQSGDFSAALEMYSAFVKLNPGSPSGFNNRGNCLRSLGEDGRAIQDFTRALELEPNRSSSRLNLSLARLALGEYEAAWPDYESRLDTIAFRKELLERRDLQWDGEPLQEGQRLFVFGNQGLGDELQCLRFLPEVFQRAGDIVVELQAATKPLLGKVPDHVSIIQRGETVPPFHRWREIFSLPRLFGVTIETIPAPVPPEFERDASIRKQLRDKRRKMKGRKQIGLVWSGNPENALNRFRSFTLEDLKPLLELDSFSFTSLQKGSAAKELEQFDEVEKLTDLGGCLHDFTSTATAIEELDLIITTDTSVIHLAGALGLEAWVLLHVPADWRWGREGEQTPWYPSLRLFRQQSPGDWAGVIRCVRTALLERFL
ncbi:MAG: tetratricopeptide repeat-containing glycosyltransferase family protein [Verrucomicrobiales bacterium]|nr:tetratricopeptide repeat-containing glycosyltransferase family protein [Verrucomicrobiales bacterium]